jgi:hypothetical protein
MPLERRGGKGKNECAGLEQPEITAPTRRDAQIPLAQYLR